VKDVSIFTVYGYGPCRAVATLSQAEDLEAARALASRQWPGLTTGAVATWQELPPAFHAAAEAEAAAKSLTRAARPLTYFAQCEARKAAFNNQRRRNVIAGLPVGPSGPSKVVERIANRIESEME
jgi:hypothetical protein